ncbi:hypothetical protein [Rhodoplanes sp. Z2-YC6860]|uniref:hypothetical protein n=1 Tax=Rhodoplanes sp. Z2-YC6860 TaxID=674703 RepID=UPI0008370185|nr:hypothetical protein [Rhodoplanes sp. Z2-YC6860]
MEERFLETFPPRVVDGFLTDRPFAVIREILRGERLPPSSSKRLTASTAFGDTAEDPDSTCLTIFSAITVAAAAAAALAAFPRMDFTPRVVSFFFLFAMCVYLM